MKLIEKRVVFFKRVQLQAKNGFLFRTDKNQVEEKNNE